MEEADMLCYSLKEIFTQYNGDSVAKGNVGQMARYSSMEEGIQCFF
jgi:hypothetical protein